MIRDDIETVEAASPNLLEEQTEQLKSIFPQVFSEGKIDFKKLRAALGDVVDTQLEKYSFSWTGKRNATLLLQTPSYATLTPSVDESINFEDTQNLFIEGDNLEILKLLYKSYSGGVKMIYIDPPYNTGNDFVYPDNYADPIETYLEITGQKDAHGNLLTSNPETSGRYHSAWLSMMYPRLYLARQLMKDDGLIFISIDDHEIHNLRILMNEIFGEENFVECFIWRSRLGKGSTATETATIHEYVLCYAKNINFVDLIADVRVKEQETKERLRQWGQGDRRIDRPSMFFPIHSEEYGDVLPIKPDGTEGRWRVSKESAQVLVNKHLLTFEKQPDGRVEVYRIIPAGTKTETAQNSILDSDIVKTTAHGTKEITELFGFKVFDYPKPTTLIKFLIKLVNDDDFIVFDFFAGSCTTAHAVLDLNREDGGSRRFICVQLPEPTGNQDFSTIAEVGKERMHRVIARKLIEEDEKRPESTTRKDPEDLGFRAFKLAPSNYKIWKRIDASDPEAYTKQLDMFADLLVDNWESVNVLWEVAIKEGYGLNTQIERLEEVQDNMVWRITDPDKEQSMLVCLDDELKPGTLSALPLSKEQIFVCRNKALDDTKAANLALQCRLKKI